MRGETRGAWPSSRAAWKNKPGIITVNLRRRHADRFRRGRLAREPVPVETSQICPPRVRDAIIGARAALERADARAPADLALATEAAEVMGSLTESTELAQALLARPVLARAARARGARHLRAPRQSPRRVAAEMGARGSRLPLSRARGIQEGRGRAQRAPRRPRALYRDALRRAAGGARGRGHRRRGLRTPET